MLLVAMVEAREWKSVYIDHSRAWNGGDASWISVSDQRRISPVLRKETYDEREFIETSVSFIHQTMSLANKTTGSSHRNAPETPYRGVRSNQRR